MSDLTDRLGELVDKVTPGPCRIEREADGYLIIGRPAWPCKRFGKKGEWDIAKIDDLGGDHPSEAKANAEFIALCFTHKDEILSALRKAEQPVSGDYAELVGRLREDGDYTLHRLSHLVSADFQPMSTQAATAIERLTAREAELRTVVALATGLVPGGYGNWHTRARLSLGDEK